MPRLTSTCCEDICTVRGTLCTMAEGSGSNGDDAKDGRRRVSNDEILNALSTGKERANAPALSTSDVADLLPISRQAVKRRLENLAQEGEIGKHKAGRNHIWWISDGGPGPGQFDLDEVVDVGDLSDDKLIGLSSEQIDPEQLPDELVDQFMDAHFTPDRIQNEMLFEALRQNVDFTELPESISSDIAQEVYGYDTSYWAMHIRAGISLLAISMLTFFVFFTGIFVTVPELSLLFISHDTIEYVIRLIAVIALLLTAMLFAGGFMASVFGLVGRAFSSTDDPRPWREYFQNLFG